MIIYSQRKYKDQGGCLVRPDFLDELPVQARPFDLTLGIPDDCERLLADHPIINTFAHQHVDKIREGFYKVSTTDCELNNS